MKIEDSFRHKGQRQQLIENLMEKGISDTQVLDAMLAMPRHYFFDQEFIDFAYDDNAFPIACNQTISQPYTVAYQTQFLRVTPGSKVLEIGTGSGYQAAVLARMGAVVFSIERKKELHDTALQIVTNLQLSINLKYGDGSLGWPEEAPFDRIIVTAAAPAVPPSLISQLANNGRMVVPVGSRDTQKMLLLTKNEQGVLTEKTLDNFKFVPLLGKEGWER